MGGYPCTDDQGASLFLTPHGICLLGAWGSSLVLFVNLKAGASRKQHRGTLAPVVLSLRGPRIAEKDLQRPRACRKPISRSGK